MKAYEGLWSAQFRGTLKFSHGTNDSRGVLIGFTENLDFTIESEHKDQEGRYLLLKCITPGVPKKKYTSLKSKIFVLRIDPSIKLVSFVREALKLEFDT